MAPLFPRPDLIDHWPACIKPVEGITPQLAFSDDEREWIRQQRAEHSLERLRVKDAVEEASTMTEREQWAYGMGLSTRPAKVITKPRRPKPPEQSESLF